MRVHGAHASPVPCGGIVAAVVAWSAVAALVAVATMTGAPSRGASADVRHSVAPPVCRIDLSTAPVEELALLPEVGPQLAARIAADRAVHGPFRSVDELTRVPGFGERRIAELRDSARVTTP